MVEVVVMVGVVDNDDAVDAAVAVAVGKESITILVYVGHHSKSDHCCW